MNTVILSKDNFVTPVKVQNAIRNRFTFQISKEVEVCFDSKEQNFDVYHNDKFICSFDEQGNEI